MGLSHYRDTLASGEDLTDQEKLALAADLEPMLMSEGWATYQVVVKRMRQETLETAITDESKPRDYYRGKLDGIDAIGGALAIMVAAGQELREAEDKKPRRPISAGVFRPGGGGFGG